MFFLFKGRGRWKVRRFDLDLLFFFLASFSTPTPLPPLPLLPLRHHQSPITNHQSITRTLLSCSCLFFLHEKRIKPRKKPPFLCLTPFLKKNSHLHPPPLFLLSFKTLPSSPAPPPRPSPAPQRCPCSRRPRLRTSSQPGCPRSPPSLPPRT